MPPSSARARAPAWLALACALAWAWITVRHPLYASWTPSDEGVLGQGAERVLRGELPHRDFVDLWSGGLDYLNAGAFALLGTKLTALRTAIGVCWLVALAAFFGAARRLVEPLIAGVLTMCVATWTLPISPDALPSWYNCFFALGGVLAVLRFLEGGRRRWLVAAGVAAAASCAVKIVGLYFIAAVLLLLVWCVQDRVRAPSERGPSPMRPYAWAITAGLLGYLALVAALMRGDFTINAAVHYLVPNAALVGVLLWREWRLPLGAERERLETFASLVAPFALGMGIVLAVWLTPYVSTHALGDLARGLFVTPRIRFIVARYPLPGLASAGPSAVPLALLLGGAPFVRRPLRRIDHAALALFFGLLAALAYDGSTLVLITWYALRLVIPVCTALMAFWLVAPPRGMEIPAERQTMLFFFVATATACSLVQIPFALYTYFLYFFPLAALAVTALAVMQPAMPRVVPAALLAYVFYFGVRYPDSLARHGPVRPEDEMALLALPRGGLMVTRQDSTTYTRLITTVQRHAAGGWMYVWHDAPQIYFLAGLRNPTPTMFEAFDDSVAKSPAHLEHALQSKGVRVVVLTDPRHAFRPMDDGFRQWLTDAYPDAEQVGTYEVRWRDAGFAAP
jgi:hypothetical protein